MIFMRRSGPPAPCVSAHIRVSNSLNSHFIFAGHGQFTKRLLIISADAKGKDQRDRAHQFRPRVVLKFGVARDDGLDARKCTFHIKQWPRRYEQVEQGSCADPGMFVRRRGGGRGPTARKQSGQCFFSHQLILQFTEWIQWFYYRGEEGVQLLPGGGGVQRNRYNLWFFRGGSGPLTPLWIRTWGRLMPLFAYRIMVYQNLNKTEKYHPKTTKWKKLSPAGRDSKCGSRGGQGVRTPLENHKLYGFL